MWSVYITIVFVWIVVASIGPLHKTDHYPFPFLLFLGNLVQLVLVFVILVGQGVLGHSSDQRCERTFNDAETILSEVCTLHSHLVDQDKIPNKGFGLVKSEAHPRVKERETLIPTTVKAQYVGLNGLIAAAITRVVSTIWAFYFAVLFQLDWIGLVLAGIITFDPYPFAFLLFISSLLQLVFMFVITVGQDVLGWAGTQRAEQTYLDTEAVGHECRRLQRHLTEQDKAVVAIFDYIESEAPQDHSIRRTLPTVTFQKTPHLTTNHLRISHGAGRFDRTRVSHRSGVA